MEAPKTVTCENIFDKNDAIDFELTEYESTEATTNIMGHPGGSIMEGMFFVYRF